MTDLQNKVIRKGLSYRRRMRRLKLGLPILAIVLIIVLIASYQTKFVEAPASFSLLNLTSEMKNMLVEGTSDANAPYRVRAATARADDTNENLIYLTIFSAQLQQPSYVMDIKAPTGLLDRSTNIMDLDTPVALDRSDGLKVRAGDSQIDLDASKMQSDDGVRIDGPDGQWLTASRFSVDAKGGRHNFAGQVKLHLPAKRAKP